MKRATFYVGEGFDSQGNFIPGDFATAARKVSMRMAAEEFGGFSATGIDGGWINPETGALVEEPAWMITVFADKSEQDFRNFAAYLTGAFKQTSVIFTIEEVTIHTWTRS